MIKDIFKEDSFTFNEWIKLFNYNELLIKVFRHEYTYMNNERKKQLILNNFNK